MKELQYINQFFYKYRFRFLLGILISIASRYLAVKIPEVVKNSLNTANDYTQGITTDLNMVKQDLLYNILYIVGLAVLSGFFTFLMRQTIIVTSRLVEFDLKNEIYQQYQRLSLNFYKKNRTGDLMNRISEDVGKVRMYVGPALMYTINMLVMFSVAIYKMVQIDIKLTLYTLIPFPVLSVSIFILSKSINNKSTIVQQQLSRLTTFTQEIFSGINVIKSYAIEATIRKDFMEIADTNKEKNIDLYKVQALFFPLMILLVGVSNIIVLYIGGMQYIKGFISIGVIAEFIIYTNMLTWPVAMVGWVTSTIQQAEASQKRINEFLDQKPEIQNHSEVVDPIQGAIAFKNVSLTYDDTNIEALKDISFTVNPGESLAILGKTGSGKSSILNLVSRLYDPTSGEVLVDGKSIQEHNVYHLRNHIGFVPQDPFLFSDTIENNVRFGKEDATEEEVVQACKKAVVHNNIIEFNKKYKTILGERGVTLSGGQKQRVSIARAIIKNPKIYVFDDCLSAVDTETEEKILRNLKSVSANNTTLIVSHRISAAQHSDKIIVLDNGKIAQQGTHKELVSSKGIYQEIYQQQLEEKEIE
ncbi:ABC transporter ATP-binding protein [Wenyingzhuangia sp. 2_MG-2023]|uniref:ABC transporter ATP-binding protein n=1 Tax=Wenyingzhuangia sp. 2_MG-2023 TaxID=3062639 RepID=UPI0026E21EA1|nr:ABC transporter ATP-binding protein [Wenyingzhuangia sp. 2_MG-2023]MDO6739139.1 ABC transporter ATP-binding protein [Wenyingzhuangia sp. 2_MG-2023]MDO6803628.1 ABC transporter ATP-binding protein [Wenyingzhuangia sp. 1_MG-2023]